MRFFLPVMVVVGCDPSEDRPATEPDSAEVVDLLDAVEPDRAIALVRTPVQALQLDGNACQVETADPSERLWVGPCLLADGALLDGTLSVRSTEDGLLLSADALVIAQGDHIEVELSGALELTRRDNLIQLDVAVQGCGALGPSCDSLVDNDLYGMNLDYSIYPADTFPSLYSATVSGAVGRADSIVGVEAAWQVDRQTCADEAVEGTIAFDTFPRQTLHLDGQDACDGCMGWRVHGVEVPALCGTDRP